MGQDFGEGKGREGEREGNVRVVAPTNCSPRAKAGLIIFPASMDPSAFPRLSKVSAPTKMSISVEWKTTSRARVEPGKRTQFINKTNNLSPTLFNIPNQTLELLLETSSHSRPGDDPCEVDGEHAFVEEGLGDFAGDYARGEAFEDGGLADAGGTEEDGV